MWRLFQYMRTVEAATCMHIHILNGTLAQNIQTKTNGRKRQGNREKKKSVFYVVRVLECKAKLLKTFRWLCSHHRIEFEVNTYAMDINIMVKEKRERTKKTSNGNCVRCTVWVLSHFAFFHLVFYFLWFHILWKPVMCFFSFECTQCWMLKLNVLIFYLFFSFSFSFFRIRILAIASTRSNQTMTAYMIWARIRQWSTNSCCLYSYS